MDKIGTKNSVWFGGGSAVPATMWQSQDIGSGLCSFNEKESFIYIYMSSTGIKSILSLLLFVGRKQQCLEE